MISDPMQAVMSTVAPDAVVAPDASLPTELRIETCIIECPTTQPSQLVLHLDVYEARTGITLNNVVAVCEAGFWTITLEELLPRSAMKAVSPPSEIAAYSLAVFEDVLVAEVKKHVIELFLLTEYESRFVPDFKESVRYLDIDQNRTFW